MTVLSDYVSRMVAAGVDQEEAFQMVAEIFAAGAANASARPSAGAMRTRKWREQNRHKTSQRDAQSAMPESVTNRHKTSQSVTSDNTPLSSSKIDLRKRGARLSPDWTPNAENRDFAKQLGWSDAQIDSEAANFRDYWIAKPGSGGCKLDWPATWRKWVRSSKVKPAGTGGTALTPEKISIEKAVEIYAKSGIWSRHAPINDVCKAPAELLAKHNILPDGRRVQ